MPVAEDKFRKPAEQGGLPPEQGTEISSASLTDNPNDQLPFITRCLHIGTGGDVRVTYMGGGVATLKNLPSGTQRAGRFTKIWATGTTADDIVAEY